MAPAEDMIMYIGLVMVEVCVCVRQVSLAGKWASTKVVEIADAVAGCNTAALKWPLNRTFSQLNWPMDLAQRLQKQRRRRRQKAEYQVAGASQSSGQAPSVHL